MDQHDIENSAHVAESAEDQEAFVQEEESYVDDDDGEVEEPINLSEFLEKRVCLLHDQYFMRNKNVNELIRNDFPDLPDPAFKKLEEMCKYKATNVQVKLLFLHKRLVINFCCILFV